MRKVFYGFAGEGLGHASRALSVIAALSDCEVHVFTHVDAYRYLSKLRLPNLHKLAGLEYRYVFGRVSLGLSAIGNLGFISQGLPNNLDIIAEQSKIHSPSLFLCDYEPSVSRAAAKLGVPCISIDNQHRFSHCDNRDLPWLNHFHACSMGVYGNLLIPHADEIIVSSFHRELLKPRRGFANVHVVDSMVRREIRDHATRNDGYGLLYIRKKAHEAKLLQAISAVDQPVKIYGASSAAIATEQNPNFVFRELGPSFVSDLATCDWVIGTSGHQLVSEARYLGKRILMVPEPGQPEQAINALYAVKLGIGKSSKLSKLTADCVEEFRRTFTPRIDRVEDGTPQVVDIVRGYLS